MGELRDLIIEGARIMHSNLAGEAGKFNAEGVRSFNLVIDDRDFAHQLAADGWNIREYIPKNADPDSEPIYLIKTFARFDKKPPKIICIKGGVQTPLNENTVGLLDHADIEHIDLIVHPYIWEYAGKSGVKAMLNEMYVTIKESPFDRKYSTHVEEDSMPF